MTMPHDPFAQRNAYYDPMVGGPVLYDPSQKKPTSHEIAVEILLAVAQGRQPADETMIKALAMILNTPAIETTAANVANVAKEQK